MNKLRLGFAPTRRFTFSKEDAHKYKNMIRKYIDTYDIEVIDIEDMNEEGLLYNDTEMAYKIADKFIREKVDAVFVPHCNFGTEDTVAKMCKEVGKPVLLWAPRDEDPLEDGTRLRDSQCGVLATGSVLRRFNVSFTYIPSTTIEDSIFKRGFENFLKAANVVKAFNSIRILQISTRPADFWSVICNEGELLEKFNIQIYPISLKEIELKTLEIEASNSEALAKEIEKIKGLVDCSAADESSVKRVAALKLAMRYYIDKELCTCAAIQCWSALQESLGIMPCLANALLTDEGIPVACETDIHGAISSVMAYAATMNQKSPFFADITVRHTSNENGELLFHCGNFPVSLTKCECKTSFNKHFLFDDHAPGTHEGEIIGGEMTIVRFDGDHGEYQLFLGKARGIEGKFTRGTYVWVEVNDWLEWEDKLVTGPYIHHCSGIHEDVVPALYEACKYIKGLRPDPVDPKEPEIKAWLRGSI
ncbi:fucose isomerase [Sporanaerobium hydrogeniformans]|uniref:Fucose isomerase n=1 Tax=Sporanaerobium hydrogeniformans TaxID=3072179 RepID=A0AC61DCH4_9FIRM|nr:L-fucose/L-arabinose isomerase family protein [Sporanaerobium hydrogeniformans]PHV70436.1 fucose isomerase [Sporanaerobium hydrogeniformans]